MVNEREVKQMIKELENLCKEKGMRYTLPRRLTLEVIAASPRPIGAYDVIDEIGKIADRPKPTTVYRAIDFLQQCGFIHRIESLNAFMACHAGHSHEGSQFIVCNECSKVVEIHLYRLPKDLKKIVDDADFKIAHWNTEIHGTCQECQA